MGARTAGCATLTEADSPYVGRLLPSPNFGTRDGRAIDALILHYTGMTSGAAALARLTDPATEVSAHYLVWEDGCVDQLVAEADRAWHAGRSFWAGETDLNSVSVGIELVNGGHDHGCPAYPPAQVEAAVALCREICSRRAIPSRRVLAHSDIAPDRKFDPGEWFFWDRLAAEGIGLWVETTEAADVSDGAVQDMLAALGYHCPRSGVTDETTRRAVAAFQRHWRPARVDGVADTHTAAVLRALLRHTT